jgi:hypothetical protein
MEQIAVVNGKKIFYHNLRQSAIELKDIEPNSWIALFITGEVDPYYKNGMSVCKRMKTPYIVCSGRSSDDCNDLYDEEAFMGFESNRESFEEPPVVIEKKGIADALNYSVYYAEPKEYKCTSIICIDSTERGVKNYLKRLAEEWIEEFTNLTPDEDEEVVTWDS